MRLFFDPACAGHRPPGHIERPGRLDVIDRVIDGRWALERASKPTLDDFAAVHSEACLARLRQTGPLYLDAGDTYLGPSSLDAALTAAGLAREAALAAMRGEGPSFAFGRPPGHHATRERQMGFCLLNSIAFAVSATLAAGCERIGIVDFDVHHGNGTQDIFYADSRVLYISLHQSPLWPFTGEVDERGKGEGEGCNVNLPMPPGCGDEDYRSAFELVVNPALDAFQPQLVLVSAGYDAHVRDRISQMRVTGNGFGWMSGNLIEGGAPAAFVLEGGYDDIGLAEGVGATLRAMAGG